MGAYSSVRRNSQKKSKRKLEGGQTESNPFSCGVDLLHFVMLHISMPSNTSTSVASGSCYSESHVL